MKRPWLVAILIFGLALSTAVIAPRAAAGQIGGAADGPPLAAYDDNTHGFRLSPSGGWSLIERGETGGGHVTQLASAADGGLAFYVVVRNLSPYATLDEWLAADREFNMREPAAVRPVEQDGVAGIEHVYSDGAEAWVARFFVRWDKVYLLNYGPYVPVDGGTLFDVPVDFTWATEPHPTPVAVLPPGEATIPPADETMAPAGMPPLQFPFCGTWRISNGYYPNAHLNDQYNKFALDFISNDGVTIGKPIYAAHSGTVKTSWDTYGGGNLSKITYNGDTSYSSWYAHLQGFSVTSGYVNAGTEIGRAGNSSPFVIGPHLHFALLQNNVSVKPEPMGGKTGFLYNQTHTRNCGGFQCSDVLPVGEGSSRKHLFVEAYNRMGGRATLGCTRGGAYWWSSSSSGLSVVRQDFTGNDGSNAVMITHDERKDNPFGSIPAYVTWGGLYSRYMALGGINSYPVGIPTSDQYINAAGQPQSSFTQGYITWDGSAFKFYNWPGYDMNQWQVKFYNGRNQDPNREPTWRMNLNTSMINYNWSTNSPGGGKWGVWADNYSMTATKMVLTEAGRHTFHIQADDGVRLWVDSTLLIDEWHSAAGTHYYADINLTKGSHLIRLAYYEEAGAALVNLDWKLATAPAAPTISAIANSDGDGAFTVGWNAVSGATSYTLQEKLNSGSFGNVYTGSQTSTGRTNRAAGTWCYRVKATNSAGSSKWSNTACATVAAAQKPIYISPTTSGKVGGISFTAADILRYDQATNKWTMVYDGSARGTPRNLAAFDVLPNNDLLLVFAGSQNIAGLGTATQFDIVLFDPDKPGVFPLGSGKYSWFFRGKSFGLTSSSEKIDAVDQTGGWITLSTTGATQVPLANGGTLKANREDVIVYELNNGRWRNTLLVDGSLIPGLAGKNINGVSDDLHSSDLYITVAGSFNLGGVKGTGKSIVRLTPNGGATGYTPVIVTWLAPGGSFPVALSEVDMAR